MASLNTFKSNAIILVLISEAWAISRMETVTGIIIKLVIKFPITIEINDSSPNSTRKIGIPINAISGNEETNAV